MSAFSNNSPKSGSQAPLTNVRILLPIIHPPPSLTTQDTSPRHGDSSMPPSPPSLVGRHPTFPRPFTAVSLVCCPHFRYIPPPSPSFASCPCSPLRWPSHPLSLAIATSLRRATPLHHLTSPPLLTSMTHPLLPRTHRQLAWGTKAVAETLLSNFHWCCSSHHPLLTRLADVVQQHREGSCRN